MESRFCLIVLLVTLFVGPSLACHLTTRQRVAVLNKAVQTLTAKERGAAPPSSKNNGSNLEVVCHQYFNSYKSRYALVRRVKVEDSAFNLREDERNTGRFNDFVLRADNVKVGTYVKVRVVWDDGETYQWEHRIEPVKTRIEIWKPN